MGDQQVDGRLGQQRPDGETHIGRLPHFLDGYGNQLRQALAAHMLRRRKADPATIGEGLKGLREAVRGAYGAVNQTAALNVAGAVERTQHVTGELAGLFKHGIDQVGGSLLIAGQGGDPVQAGQFGEGETNVVEGCGVIGHGG